MTPLCRAGTGFQALNHRIPRDSVVARPLLPSLQRVEA